MESLASKVIPGDYVTEVDDDAEWYYVEAVSPTSLTVRTINSYPGVQVEIPFSPTDVLNVDSEPPGAGRDPFGRTAEDWARHAE